jgi:N-acetylglucosaminyldiphosphoundecaprenol N-acetyl-beta-D-mannosaminyltransferase
MRGAVGHKPGAVQQVTTGKRLPMIDRGKRNLLGVWIDAVDYEAAVSKIITAARSRQRCTVTALAVHGVMTGALDPVHRYRLNHLDLTVPDGQPVRWAINYLYRTRLKDRVYGPNLTMLVCQEAARLGLPVFFYGSREPVVRNLVQRTVKRYPGLCVAGYEASQFRTLSVAERDATVDRITASGARIVFVGLGCPRQEVFAYEMGDQLQMPILAVGAAFDYHSGFVSEPPRYLQKAGLQWLYRLAQDPRRLWRRYLILNSKFLLRFALQALRLRVTQPSDVKCPPGDLLYG